MQTFLRVLNLILGPILTLVFAGRFKGLTISGSDAAKEAGGALASLVMLAVELALTQGPKHSAWLRRWLDPRAAFEGVWLQEDRSGRENALSIFSMDFRSDSDSYTLEGRSYSIDGSRWADWESTHVFVDRRQLRATYIWKGTIVGPGATDASKSGQVRMSLRAPPSFSLPMVGEGDVLHLGEATGFKFRLRRVTPSLLAELGLPFTLRELCLDAHDEEAQLAAADLRVHPPAQPS